MVCSKPSISVALCGGGTGGHLFPGLALCEALERSDPPCRVTLFRTRRSVEDDVLCGRDVETVAMELAPPGRGLLGRLRFLGQLAREVSALRRHIASAGVDVVVGLGGYASVPGIVAARLSHVPVILLEQNATPGKVNRLLGPLAECIAVPDGESVGGFGAWRALVRLAETGNPLRRDVLEASRWRSGRDAGERRRSIGAGDRRVLVVMGGSQGARSINRFVTDALERCRQYSDKIYCIHISGTADKETVEAAYRRCGWEARVAAFDPELPRALAAADLVLARAGGSTTAELAAIGVPSILVPFPGHGDRHQLKNAHALARCGAARVLEEGRFDVEPFESVLDCLFDDCGLEAMQRAARSAGRLDGAERVASLVRATVEAAARRKETQA